MNVLLRELIIRNHAAETYIPELKFEQHTAVLCNVFLKGNTGRATVKNALCDLCEEEEASFTASFINEIENITFYSGEVKLRSICSDIVEVTKPANIIYFDVSSESVRYHVTTFVKREVTVENAIKFSLGNSVTFTMVPKDEYKIGVHDGFSGLCVLVTENMKVETPLCNKELQSQVVYSCKPPCLNLYCSLAERIPLFKVDMMKKTSASFKWFHERIQAAFEKHGFPEFLDEQISRLLNGKTVEFPEEVTVMLDTYFSDLSQLKMVLSGCYLLMNNMKFTMQVIIKAAKRNHSICLQYALKCRPMEDFNYTIGSSMYISTKLPLVEVKNCWFAEYIDVEMFNQPKDKFINCLILHNQTFAFEAVRVLHELVETNYLSISSTKKFKKHGDKPEEEVSLQLYDRDGRQIAYDPSGAHLFYLLCNALQIETDVNLLMPLGKVLVQTYDDEIYTTTKSYDLETGVLKLNIICEILNMEVDLSIHVKTRQATSLMVNGLHRFCRTSSPIMGSLLIAIHRKYYTDCLVKF